jgi:hypothetical protein
MHAATVRPLVVLVALVPLVVACGGSAAEEQTTNRLTTGGTNTVTVQVPSGTVPTVARFTAKAGAACVHARRHAPTRAPRGTAGLVQYAEGQASAAQHAAAELARVKAPPSHGALLQAVRRGYARLLPIYARVIKAGATKDRAGLRRARRSLQRAERATSRAAVAAGVPACAPRPARAG